MLKTHLNIRQDINDLVVTVNELDAKMREDLEALHSSTPLDKVTGKSLEQTIRNTRERLGMLATLVYFNTAE
jgi:hypothetical protein